MATNINNRLVCNEPHANLDSYYGPYNNVHAAYTALADTTVNGITYTKKYIGLTVGVWKDSSHTEITEYWFKGGLSESNLVEKTSDAGLPGGVKIVTFDKNGGSGVQNSIITDTESKIKLPACTFEKSGDTFKNWSYNGTEIQDSVGAIITIGTSTVVQALWSSSPTPKPSHEITWSAGTGINKITGTANGVAISSRDRVKEDSTIVLTATMNSGYNFSQWSGLPSGTSSNNPVTFTMGTSDIAVTAIGKAVISQYTLTYNSTEGIRELTCMVDGEPKPSGVKHNEGSTVLFTVVPEEGYSVIWEGAPKDAQITDEGKTLTFILRGDTTIRVKGEKKPIETGFYYYGCTSTENGAKGGGEDVTPSGGEGEDVDPSGETGRKWFESADKLISSNKQTSVTIDNGEAKYNILYVVRNTNAAPTCTYDRGDSVRFVPINECGDDEIYNHFVRVNMIEPNTNQTLGDLADKGAYMFVLIDNGKVLADKTFTISIENK